MNYELNEDGEEVVTGRRKTRVRYNDRPHPDVVTNDYIYVRGDWDYLGKWSKREIKEGHMAYIKHIEKVRKDLGLSR